MIVAAAFNPSASGSPDASPGSLATWTMVLGATVAAVWVARGILGARRLPLGVASNRPVQFEPLDLLAVFLLGWVIGLVALQYFGHALGLTTDGPVDSTVTLATVLLGQTLTQAPIALYFVLRMARSDALPRRGGPFDGKGLRIVLQSVACGTLLVGVVLVVSNFGVELAAAFGAPRPETGHTMLEAVQASTHPFVKIGLVLSAVIVAPVLEEAVYRGVIQSAFASIAGHRRIAAVGVTSLLFTAAHAGAVPWQMLPGLLLVSMVLGWLYERTATLIAPILAHAVFNGLNLCLYLAVA